MLDTLYEQRKLIIFISHVGKGIDFRHLKSDSQQKIVISIGSFSYLCKLVIFCHRGCGR
jgi:hypothetical protein